MILFLLILLFTIVGSYATSMTFCYHRMCNQCNKTGAASRARTAYPSGTPEFFSSVM